jgi:hypothetical protein
MLHELRHSNQFVQILQVSRGEPTQEPIEIVKQWAKSFENYTHNEGDDVSPRWQCHLASCSIYVP